MLVYPLGSFDCDIIEYTYIYQDQITLMEIISKIYTIDIVEHKIETKDTLKCVLL